MPTKKSVNADGQIASSEGDVYVYGSAATANQADTKVYQFFVLNTSATTQTISAYIKPAGGTSRQIRQVVLAQNESAEIIDSANPVVLSPGDAIRADTTTASVVDYVIVAEIAA